MTVTAKKFYPATLLKAAGCSAETLRSWRTRNGLFPEMQGAGTWNKFSIIDMFVVWIVTDLTKRRVAAQAAVNAAMACAPILEKLCEFDAGELHPDNMEDVFLAVAYRIAKSNSILGLKLTADEPPVVQLMQAETSVRASLDQGFSILIDVRRLLLVVSTLVIDDVDYENVEGERSRWIGQFSALRQADDSAKSSGGTGSSGKRMSVRGHK